MNPRILKKLSKRVVEMGIPRDRHVAYFGGEDSDYRPFRASRKPSHREPLSKYRLDKSGRPSCGDMYTLHQTPWICWSECNMDESYYESVVAWQFMEQWTRSVMQDDALDYSHPSCAEGGWPPYKNGLAPKYPRNTWEMLRAIRAVMEKQSKLFVMNRNS